MKRLELNAIECSMLNEIAKENYNNITPEYFGASQDEFQKGLACLKENNLIIGDVFGSNGTMREGFKFFSILDRGERYLKTGRI